ncbi:MAG: transcriptional regulator [Paenibacillus sp.]|jgi:AraC-like DNA-binding protein|nr:transcriptional regulator [Paenibacillus sp.]
MELNPSIFNEAPIWNNEVDQQLRHEPVYTKRDTIKEHKKRHIQPGVELNICHQGRAVVVVGNEMFMHSPDHLMLIPGHIPHQIYPDLSSMEYKRSTVCLNDQLLQHFVRLDQMEDLRWMASPSSYQFFPDAESVIKIKAFADEIHREYVKRGYGWQTMMLSYLLAISVLLRRTSMLADERKDTISEAGHNVRACTDYIHANLGEDLSLPTVAHMLQISQEHLIRIFKREKGMTYHQYVLLQRVLASKKLLREQQTLSLTDIAYYLGFTSSSQFTRVFKKTTGMIPSEYRLLENP